MPLDFQNVDVKFTEGLDTHDQRKLVVPGKWDTLINVSLAEDGSVKRRDGFEAILDGQAGTGLATRDNELLVINGEAVSTVSEVGTNVAKQANGRLPFFDVGRLEVVANGAMHDQQDMAYGNGYACYVWRNYAAGGGTATGTQVTVIDLSSGAKVVNQFETSAAGIAPRVVFANDAFFVFHMAGAGGSITCTVIDTTAPSTVGTPTAIVTDVNVPAENFDACAFNDAPLIAYRYADGATSVQARYVIRTGTTPSAMPATNVITEAAVTNASIHAIAVCGYSDDLHAGIFVVHTAGGALGGGLVGVVVEDTIGVTTAATLIDGTVPPVATDTHVTAVAVGSNLVTFFDQQSSYLSANLRPLRFGIWSSALVGISNAMLNSACFRINAAEASGPQGPFIAGKAFASNGIAYLPVCMLENYFRPLSPLGVNTDTTSTQCSFYLLRFIPGIAAPFFRVVAGALYGSLGLVDPTLGGNAPTIGTPCSTPALDVGFGICLQERARNQLARGVNIAPVGLSHITLTPQTRTPVRAQLGESTYFASGQLGAYDGQQVLQHGFPMHPEGISVVRVNTGGAAGKLTVGVHDVVAVYEWTDGAGNRHQSAPSLPVSVTVSLDTDTITVLVPTTQLPQSAGYDTTISTLIAVCYMTAADGTVFYRVVNSYATPDANTTAASTVTVNIGLNSTCLDTMLTQNEPLYTQPEQAGTTLRNIAPGPLHGIGVSQQRLWGFISDEPGEYTYSQEPLQNTGLQFNPNTLVGRLPTAAGAGVLVAELDEKTILLCENGLYVVYGTGPTPSGGFNNFSDPQPIPTDVGCVEARSVLSMPNGIIFKSAKGWMLLRRDLSVQYIGAGVAAYDTSNVTSAVLMGDRQECRFAGTDGPTLVYAYEVVGPDGVGQWSVFYMENALHPGNVLDAVWWPATGRYVHLHDSTGIFPGLMQDTPGVYVDGAGTSDPLQATIFGRTSFLHVGAMERFQRVRMMYLTATAETALPENNLVIAIDFNDVYAGPLSYNFTTDLGGITSFDEQAVDLRHRLTVQKCKSVAFSFLEGGTTDYDAIPLTGIQAIGLEVGLKKGVNKLPSTQTVGP